jgi:hypothetical protein
VVSDRLNTFSDGYLVAIGVALLIRAGAASASTTPHMKHLEIIPYASIGKNKIVPTNITSIFD